MQHKAHGPQEVLLKRFEFVRGHPYYDNECTVGHIGLYVSAITAIPGAIGMRTTYGRKQMNKGIF